MHTEQIFNLQRVWVATLGEQHILFKLKACADAHVVLSKNVGLTSIDSYEIHIGAQNNTMSYIRQGVNGGVMDEDSTRGILSCTTSQWYWISWSTNYIEFGKGSYVGHEIVLAWQSGYPQPIEGVSVSTDVTSTGTWEFTSIAG